MSRRLQNRSGGARQSSLASPRAARSKESGTSPIQGTGSRRRNPVRRLALKTMEATSSSDASVRSEEDDSAGDGSDGDNEDEGTSEDAEPEYEAPSHVPRRREAGRFDYKHSDDNLSLLGDSKYDPYYIEDEDPNLSPEENQKVIEQKIFADSADDDDDDACSYTKVDEISESEDEKFAQEELQILVGLEDEDPDNFLNQIDGLSAYGFGEGSDFEFQVDQYFPSSQESDIDFHGEEEPSRRVHFATTPVELVLSRFSESPVLGRALLPSALPDTSTSHNGNDLRNRNVEDDAYDSDATVECLPPEAQLSVPSVVPVPDVNAVTPTAAPASSEMTAKQKTTKRTKKTNKKKKKLRGPPRGIFYDDVDKPSGILDSTGKIMLMTNPHLLGEEFAKRYGASQTSSPDLGFAEVIEESDSAGTPSNSVNAGGVDIMLTSLASDRRGSNGNAIGPSEAFFPADGFNASNYVFGFDDLDVGAHFDNMDAGEHLIRLEDVISIPGYETEDDDSPTSPIYMPPAGQESVADSMNKEFKRVTKDNVAAFRRNADPQYAALSNTPSFRDMSLFTNTISTPPPKRKRSSKESPYNHSHYDGVTPVHRVRASDYPEGHMGMSEPSTKRRRVMTPVHRVPSLGYSKHHTGISEPSTKRRRVMT